MSNSVNGLIALILLVLCILGMYGALGQLIKETPLHHSLVLKPTGSEYIGVIELFNNKNIKVASGYGRYTTLEACTYDVQEIFDKNTIKYASAFLLCFNNDNYKDKWEHTLKGKE